jgi:hypothetical protein
MTHDGVMEQAVQLAKQLDNNVDPRSVIPADEGFQRATLASVGGIISLYGWYVASGPKYAAFIAHYDRDYSDPAQKENWKNLQAAIFGPKRVNSIENFHLSFAVPVTVMPRNPASVPRLCRTTSRPFKSHLLTCSHTKKGFKMVVQAETNNDGQKFQLEFRNRMYLHKDFHGVDSITPATTW